MYSTYYFLAYLSLGITAITAPFACMMLYSARSNAVKRRLNAYLPWLTPSVIATIIHTVGMYIMTGGIVFRVQPPLVTELYSLSYILDLIATGASLYGLSKLWKMMKTLPLTPPETPATIPDTGAWPPAPKVS